MSRRDAWKAKGVFAAACAGLFLVLAGSARADAVSPPTSLAASAVSSSQIKLTWVDTNSNETGYLVERSLSSSSGFVQIASLPQNTQIYYNTGLAAATLYYYRVRAVKNGAYSAYSNVVSARTLSTLSPPTSLTASAASSSQINLTWIDTNSTETGYLIERSLSSSSGFVQIASLPQNTQSYSSTGLAAATTYYYRVRAVNNGAYSTYSNVASARTLSTGSIPAAPSNLTAAAASSSVITIAWKDNSTNETAFRVERAPASAGPWTYIGATTLTGYGDSGLLAATLYYYRVAAYNSYGTSAYSNTASATTQGTTSLPSAPSSLSASAVSSSQVNLTWRDNSTNETAFKIERSTSTVSWAQIATVGSNVTSYSSTGLSASTTYSYRVRATNTAGDSAYSNTASATTSAALSGTGSFIWSKDFGGTGAFDSAVPLSLAVDSLGELAITGTLENTVNLGTGSMTSAGSTDIFEA
jgi:hypothetical protein